MSQFHFSDVNLSFERHPITKDIMKVTDVRAILQSLRLLVRTHATEILMEPEISGSLDHQMFRGNTNLTSYNIKSKITEVIINHEPRVELKDVEVYTIDSPQYQELYVRIYFYFLNVQELQTIDIPVSRLR